MKLRRLVALFMVGSMVFMTGCAKQVPTGTEEDKKDDLTEELVPEEGAELTYWTSSIEVGERLAKQFEEEYGVKVSVEQVQFDGLNKLTTEGPTGNGADVVSGNLVDVIPGSNAGVFEPVDERLLGELKESMQEVAVQSATVDNTVYGFPISIETSGLIYNKDLVADPAETFEQIAEEAKKFNNPAENKFYFLSSITGYTLYPFLSAGGFQLFGEDGMDNDNPGFDSPEFVKGLEYVKQIADMIPVESENLRMEADTFIEQNFMSGKTAYMQAGPWSLVNLSGKDINFGVIPFASIEGNKSKPFASVTMNFVSTYSKYPNAAQLFAMYTTKAEAAESYYELSKAITARKDIEKIEGLNKDEHAMAFAEAFKDAVPQPGVSRMSYYWPITESVLSAVFDGQLTPEEGAKKAQKDFEGLVAAE